MSFFYFTPKKTHEQLMKETLQKQKRILVKTKNAVNREINAIEREETRVTKRLEKMCEKSYPEDKKREEATKIRDLRKRRTQTTRTLNTITNATAKLEQAKQTATMTKALKEVAIILYQLNNLYPIKDLQVISNEYQKQNMNMDIKEEIIDDVFESLQDDDEDEDETEEQILDDIMEEANLKLKETLSIHSVPANDNSTIISEFIEDDLEKRLNALKSNNIKF